METLGLTKHTPIEAPKMRIVPNKSFMYMRPRNPQFEEGVKAFLDYAEMNPKLLPSGNLCCPCKKCRNICVMKRELVRQHLVANGFLASYTYWHYHGEGTDDEEVRLERERVKNMQNELPGKERAGNPDENDKVTKDGENVEVPLDPKDVEGLLKLLEDDGQNLNDMISGMTNKHFQMLLDLLRRAIPKGEECIPKSYDQVQKVVTTFGLHHKKNDARPDASNGSGKRGKTAESIRQDAHPQKRAGSAPEIDEVIKVMHKKHKEEDDLATKVTLPSKVSDAPLQSQSDGESSTLPEDVQHKCLKEVLPNAGNKGLPPIQRGAEQDRLASLSTPQGSRVPSIWYPPMATQVDINRLGTKAKPQASHIQAQASHIQAQGSHMESQDLFIQSQGSHMESQDLFIQSQGWIIQAQGSCIQDLKSRLQLAFQMTQVISLELSEKRTRQYGELANKPSKPKSVSQGSHIQSQSWFIQAQASCIQDLQSRIQLFWQMMQSNQWQRQYGGSSNKPSEPNSVVQGSLIWSNPWIIQAQGSCISDLWSRIQLFFQMIQANPWMRQYGGSANKPSEPSSVAQGLLIQPEGWLIQAQGSCINDLQSRIQLFRQMMRSNQWMQQYGGPVNKPSD